MAVGAEVIFGDSVITTRLDSAINWARESSMWPYIFGTACCAIEFMSVASSKYDISRFGAEVVRFSPRQADLMIVAGTISYKQAPILKRIYDQMTEPKWVISAGACACSGGFYDNYTTLQGIDSIIPVDVYIAGCPPRPEAFLDALLQIQTLQNENESILKERTNRNFKGLLDETL
jgi:NADH-quinone oxidoreductase subunit B